MSAARVPPPRSGEVPARESKAKRPQILKDLGSFGSSPDRPRAPGSLLGSLLGCCPRVTVLPSRPSAAPDAAAALARGRGGADAA